MNCLEYFVKGDPQIHEKKLLGQQEQLQHYLRLFKRFCDTHPNTGLGRNDIQGTYSS